MNTKRKLLYLYVLAFNYTTNGIVLAILGKLGHLCEPTEKFVLCRKQPDTVAEGVIRLLIVCFRFERNYIALLFSWKSGNETKFPVADMITMLKECFNLMSSFTCLLKS